MRIHALFAIVVVAACAAEPPVVDTSDAGGVPLLGGTEPDLVVTAIAEPPAEIAIGAVMTVGMTVANLGFDPAPPQKSRWYLSLDQSFDDQDRILGAQEWPTIFNIPKSVVREFPMPFTVPPGDYFLVACADFQHTVAEADETNNCLASTGVVTVRSPDLVVSAVSEPPAVSATGARFTVTDTTTSQGTVDVTVTTVTRAFLSLDAIKDAGDRALDGQRAVPPLAIGASSTGSALVKIPTTTVPGTYFMITCADKANVVKEGDELNNCRTSTGTVTIGGSDLAVAAVTNPPATLQINESFAVTDTTGNLGAGPTQSSLTRFYLSIDATFDAGDKQLIGERVVPIIPGNQASTGTTTLKVPSIARATYFLIACADATAAVTENDETNNCLTAAAQVAVTAADLVEDEVTFTPGSVALGATFAVTDSVRNAGGFPALASISKVFLSLDLVKGSGDRALEGNRAIAALAAGEIDTGTRVVRVPTNLAPGAYFVIACADHAGVIVETNEANNCVTSATMVDVIP
jgi:subtilase family serine protease